MQISATFRERKINFINSHSYPNRVQPALQINHKAHRNKSKTSHQTLTYQDFAANQHIQAKNATLHRKRETECALRSTGKSSFEQFCIYANARKHTHAFALNNKSEIEQKIIFPTSLYLCT